MTLVRRLAILSILATLLQIAVGGFVRATGSGLGCGDDWPQCSGRLVPSLADRAMVIEFSHRLVATVVVALVGTLAVVALLRRREHPRLAWPSIAAFLLVMAQAVAGMIVVSLHLEAESVIFHLGLALALLALLIYVGALCFAAEDVVAAPADETASRLGRTAAAAVFVLLLVGSYVSGTGAGLVFPDWPLMNGRVIPNLEIELQAIHFLHRALALVVGAILVWCTVRILRRSETSSLVRKLAHTAVGLFLVEVVIGAANVWTDLNVAAVTLHLTIGALIWGSLVTLTVVTHPKLAAVAADRGGRPAAAVAGEGAHA